MQIILKHRHKKVWHYTIINVCKNLTEKKIWIYLVVSILLYNDFIKLSSKMDIKKQMEYFSSLPYDVKRAKVLEMLKQLQWTHETFSMFYKTVNSLEKVPEKVLIYIYQWIIEIAESIEQWKKEDAQEKIKHMSEVLMTIKKQEEMEREREGNPDEMLKNM